MLKRGGGEDGTVCVKACPYALRMCMRARARRAFFAKVCALSFSLLFFLGDQRKCSAVLFFLLVEDEEEAKAAMAATCAARSSPFYGMCARVSVSEFVCFAGKIFFSDCV